MIDIEQEYIICSAIWYKDNTENRFFHYKVPSGQVIAGWRHGNIIALRPTNPAMNGGVKCVQGFLTSSGRFVDRWQAMEIAYSAGQVSKQVHDNPTYVGDVTSIEASMKIVDILESEPQCRHHDNCPMRMMMSEHIY
jgi:hypothetical protein